MPPRRKRPPAKDDSESQSKAARLMQLGRKSHVSQSGIAKLLESVQKDGLPESFSRATLYRARKKISRETTPYGPLVVDHDLRTGVIGIQQPMPILYKCTNDCEGFRALLASTHRRCAGSTVPWRIVMHNDGITPQDSVSLHDRRKLVSFYWSFLDFGVDALSVEANWFVLATVRKSVFNSYDGGLSAFFRDCLRKYFFESGGNDFGTTGLMVPKLMFLMLAHPHVVIADCPALKDFFMSKGHTGYLPCLLCANVINTRFFDDSIGPPFVTIACDQWSRFLLHSDASIKRVLENLRLDGGEEKELVAGFSYHENSLALDPLIDIPRMTMYDWMHIYLVGGLLDNELGQCMASLKHNGAPTTYEVLGAFVQRFKWPSKQAPSKKLFDEEAIRKHTRSKSFSCTASELLSLMPVLAYYFVAVALPQGVCVPQVQSLISLLDEVELVATVRTGIVSPSQLRSATSRHFTLFKEAYGEGSVVPKHHFALHLWHMLQIFGCLLSCFTMERLHQIWTKYAKNSPQHHQLRDWHHRRNYLR